MGRDPVQVVQAPLPRRHRRMVCGGERGPGRSSRRVSRHRVQPSRVLRSGAAPAGTHGPGGRAAGIPAVPAVTSSSSWEARQAGGAQLSPSVRAGRAAAGRLSAAATPARRRSRRGPRTPAPASGGGTTVAPPLGFRGSPALPVPGCLVALGGAAGPGLLLLLPHPGSHRETGRPRPSSFEQHGEQAASSDCGDSPAARASCRRSSAVLSEKAGISPRAGARSSAAHATSPGRRGPGRTPAAGHGGRCGSPDSPLRCPPRADRFPSYGSSAGSALPYQSPPIFTRGRRGSSPVDAASS